MAPGTYGTRFLSSPFPSQQSWAGFQGAARVDGPCGPRLLTQGSFLGACGTRFLFSGGLLALFGSTDPRPWPFVDCGRCTFLWFLGAEFSLIRPRFRGVSAAPYAAERIFSRLCSLVVFCRLRFVHHLLLQPVSESVLTRLVGVGFESASADSRQGGGRGVWWCSSTPFCAGSRETVRTTTS